MKDGFLKKILSRGGEEARGPGRTGTKGLQLSGASSASSQEALYTEHTREAAAGLPDVPETEAAMERSSQCSQDAPQGPDQQPAPAPQGEAGYEPGEIRQNWLMALMADPGDLGMDQEEEVAGALPIEAPSPGASQGEATLEKGIQDEIVTALLRSNIVSAEQAFIASQHPASREIVPWRLIAENKNVNREAIFAEVARLRGIATVAVREVSIEFMEAALRLFSPEKRERFLQLGLLPFEFILDTEKNRHGLVVASHDPTNAQVEAFVASAGVRIQLRYAAEGAIAARLQQFQKAAREALRLESAGPAAGPERMGTPEQSGLSIDALVRAVHTDVLPEEDVVVEERFNAAEPDLLTGDGYGGVEPPSGRYDLGPDEQPGVAEEADLSDATPVPRVANWTQQSNQPPATKPPSQEPPSSGAPPPPSTSEEKPSSLSAAELEAVKRKDRVVAMLLRKDAVSPYHVAEAQRIQREERSKEALWRILAQVSGVDREAVFAETARVYAFRSAKLGNGKPDPDFVRTVVEMFSEDLREKLLKLRVLPYESELESQSGTVKLIFVTHDPTRPEVHRLLQQLKLERFELCYVPEPVVLAVIAEVFPKKNEYLERISDDSRAFDLGTSYDQKTALIDEDALEAEISRSTLINLFEATLVEAVRQGASDIHIYPNAKKKVEIHFRVDGRLSRWHLEDKVHPEAFLAVIKDNAINVDRFERDAAQDGFIQRWIDEALIRFRVSVLPIANAAEDIRSESIVIRVLDDRKVITDLKKLGLLNKALERFDRAIRQPHGMVILTGPTGSGKSTTLVAALHQVVTPEVNVLTVEDPVEYIIPGVRQIKLNHKLGLEEALRAILRHDPDVVMVGEMRDRQTAELAIKLSNTGHLTFSTLHTNDAPSAISRLYKMGIEPFLIAYAINLVVAQRLIRRLCPDCKIRDDDPDPVMLKQMGFTEEEVARLTFYTVARDPKCPTCKGVGYKGRRAISEALYFSRTVRHIIAESKGHLDEGVIRDQAVKEGMLTLRDSAREYVKLGETSVLEMIRVTTTEE